MDEYFLSVARDDGSLLCIAPLTNRQIAVAEQELEDTSGLFLFEQCGSEGSLKVNVIARVLSEEAALMFRRTFAMS